MNVELFLEGQARWEVDSPHCLMMLHEMFHHTLEQGQKETEQMVCWGCQHRLLKLDPEADVSTVQLVGSQTSRKEIESLYYEVYKLCRLLGSPPRELELVAEGWCPPWKTARGRNEGKYHRCQGSLIQLTTGPWGAGPPKRGGMPPGEEFSLRWEKPTIGLW